MKTGNVITGILAGFAAGAVLGILFAPDRGSATRKKMVDKGNDLAHDLKHRYDEMRDTLQHKMQSTTKAAKDIVDKGKETIGNAKDEVELAAWDFKNKSGVLHNA